MHVIDIAAIIRQAFVVVVELSAPALLSALLVGLLVSVFQAVTQINESTLAFVPKVLAVGAALLLTGPFMMATLKTYTVHIYDSLVAVGGQ